MVYYCYGDNYETAPVLPNEPMPEGEQEENRPVWNTTYTFDATRFLWQTIKVQSGTNVYYSTPVCLGQPRVKSVSQEYCKLLEGETPTKESSWIDVKPMWEAGTCLWTRTKTLYVDLVEPIYSIEILDTSWGQISKLDVELADAQKILDSFTTGTGTVTINGSEIIIRGRPRRNANNEYVDEAGNVLDITNPDDVKRLVYDNFLKINDEGIGFSSDRGENYNTT